MSRDALDWRVRSGRWTRVHTGVVLTKPGRSDWTTRATAALLFALSGDVVADAALCGQSAAYLWGLVSAAPTTIELVVPQRRNVTGLDGVRIRRSMRWDNLVDERAYPWRTTLATTVLDIATPGTPLDALSIVARAVQRELVTPRVLLQEMTARGGHRYSKILRPGLADVTDGAQSGAEVLYIRDVERAHGLPTATRQAPSDRGRRRFHDSCYEEEGVIVEVDGRLGHERWADRVRDGRRDRELLTGSHVTTRVFFADVALTPFKTAADIGAILRTRGWRGALRRCRRQGCAV